MAYLTGNLGIAIILVSVILLLLGLFLLKYYLQRRSEIRLQQQVKSILFEYMPMEGYEMTTSSTLGDTLL